MRQPVPFTALADVSSLPSNLMVWGVPCSTSLLSQSDCTIVTEEVRDVVKSTFVVPSIFSPLTNVIPAYSASLNFALKLNFPLVSCVKYPAGLETSSPFSVNVDVPAFATNETTNAKNKSKLFFINNCFRLVKYFIGFVLT